MRENFHALAFNTLSYAWNFSAVKPVHATTCKATTWQKQPCLLGMDCFPICCDLVTTMSNATSDHRFRTFVMRLDVILWFVYIPFKTRAVSMINGQDQQSEAFFLSVPQT